MGHLPKDCARNLISFTCWWPKKISDICLRRPMVVSLLEVGLILWTMPEHWKLWFFPFNTAGSQIQVDPDLAGLVWWSQSFMIHQSMPQSRLNAKRYTGNLCNVCFMGVNTTSATGWRLHPNGVEKYGCSYPASHWLYKNWSGSGLTPHCSYIQSIKHWIGAVLTFEVSRLLWCHYHNA